MNQEIDQVEARNIEIVQEINDDIMARYKGLKKDLAVQKDGKVNDTILNKMKEILVKTEELSNEVDLRMGDYAVDHGLIRSLETFNSPLEYIKQQYVQVQSNPEIAKIQKIQERANLALGVLEQS